MNNLNENVYQESYFGKREEFKKCEMYLDEIRDFILSNPNNLVDCNKLQANKKLEKELCNIFGFRRAYIVWQALDVPNAYTIINSHVHFSNVARAITIDKKKGYYDPTHQDVLFICLYNGLVSKNKLSSSEILGVMLHEIGHNFDYSFYNTIYYVLNYVESVIMDSYLDKGFKAQYAQHALDENEKLIKNQDKKKDYEDYKKANAKLRAYSTALMSPFLTIKDIVISPLTAFITPIVQIESLFGKRKEHFSDSFATAYGYGYDMLNALEKLHTYPKSLIKADNFTKYLYDLGVARYEVSLALMEVHGTNQERVKMSIKKLENDLKSGNYPPECKHEIMKEIDKLNDLYNKIISLDPVKKNKFTSMVRKFFDKVFDGIPNIQKLFPKNQV